ncbi:MAG: TrkA family potassium uptake protein [Deltaproteobacteria bacterium]|nr:MAG: TrkA family potassium uptake protein [Deltaproteobacteria bacterium]HEX15648.1 TrkA family potassium uptake protein [Deltaproteobacteria bacterium]
MKFGVIGLGNFGATVARALFEGGHEVVVLDRDKGRVQAAQKFASQAIIADATQKKVLEELGLDKMDAVVVSLGKDLSASVLVTLYLRDLKVKKIVVKIASEDHGRVLEKVGATEIVFPEKDMALRLAQSLTSPNILDYLPLSPEFSLIELAPPKDFIGKSLAELRLRSRYGVNVLAVRQIIPEKMIINPPADFVIKDSDVLVVLGRREDIERIK